MRAWELGIVGVLGVCWNVSVVLVIVGSGGCGTWSFLEYLVEAPAGRPKEHSAIIFYYNMGV